LALALEETVSRAKISESNIVEMVTRTSMEQKVADGIITDDVLDMLYTQYKGKNPEMLDAIVSNMKVE
jgi:hypothetical protein